MAVAISTKKHGVVFPSKLLAGFGGAHQYNITIAKDHDNGELVTRGEWNSFDNYDEGSAAVEFSGVIREPAAEGGYYIEVTAATEALLLYNTPINPYTGREFEDDALFFNAAGDVVRGYALVKGDIFAVSENMFDGKIVTGKAVSFANGKYVVAK